jgi:ankyrin repeat protein
LVAKDGASQDLNILLCFEVNHMKVWNIFRKSRQTPSPAPPTSKATAAATPSAASTPSPSPTPTIPARSEAGSVAEPLRVGSTEAVTDLCEAARQGDLAAIVRILDREPAMVNARDSFGQTALHCAAGTGHKTVVELLIARGADVNVADSQVRRTPLHLACANNHKDIVTLLLSNGADLNATCDGGLQEGSPTSLQMAITRGQTEVAEVLINMGADVNRDFGPGLHCLRPLHVAAAMGNERLVTLLLDKGAKVTAGDLDGRTALQFARMKGHVGVARCLTEKGAVR